MLYTDDIVYTDPTVGPEMMNDVGEDVIAVTPPSANGQVYGTISIAHFYKRDDINSGTVQSVCVLPGEEIALLELIALRLTGKRYTLVEATD